MWVGVVLQSQQSGEPEVPSITVCLHWLTKQNLRPIKLPLCFLCPEFRRNCSGSLFALFPAARLQRGSRLRRLSVIRGRLPGRRLPLCFSLKWIEKQHLWCWSAGTLLSLVSLSLSLSIHSVICSSRGCCQNLVLMNGVVSLVEILLPLAFSTRGCTWTPIIGFHLFSSGKVTAWGIKLVGNKAKMASKTSHVLIVKKQNKETFCLCVVSPCYSVIIMEYIFLLVYLQEQGF